MRLGDRLARLEKTLGRADAKRPDIIIIRSVMEPGEDGPRSFAMVLRGPDGVMHIERGEGETEAEFELRVGLFVAPACPSSGRSVLFHTASGS